MEKVLHITLVLRNEDTGSNLKLKGMNSMPDIVFLDVEGQIAQMPVALLEKALAEIKNFQEKAKDL